MFLTILAELLKFPGKGMNPLLYYMWLVALQMPETFHLVTGQQDRLDSQISPVDQLDRLFYIAHL